MSICYLIIMTFLSGFLLPKHQAAILPDAKLGVLHPPAVPHHPAIAHHVAQTQAASGVEEAGILGVQTPSSDGRLLHCRQLAFLAAAWAARLQHRQGPQRVMNHRHVTWRQ